MNTTGSLKVKLKLPDVSSPGRVVLSPTEHKKHKKRHHGENDKHRKKPKRQHSQERDDTSSARPTPSETTPLPAPPKPNYADMLRVIDHLQKQDRQDIFKDPVTDDVAPGYSSIVTEPMDFTTLRKKFTGRDYQSWEALEADMMLMFDNSMLYNPPDTIYYKQSMTLKEVAKKLVELGRKGVTNFRGKTAGVVRAHNAQVAADERAEKNALKAAVRAQRMQMKNDKLLQKAAANGILLPSTGAAPSLKNASRWNAAAGALNIDGRRPLLPEEHTRATYRPVLSNKSVAAPWGGLISGRNPAGVTFVGPPLRLIPQNTTGITYTMYKNSANSFVDALRGRAKDYAYSRMGLNTGVQ